MLRPSYLFVCSSATERAPVSPHFPYTTLFRSHRSAGEADQSPAAQLIERLAGAVPAVQAGRELVTESETGRDPARSADRKSTRLNSSHPSISYAVSCLKTKKKPRMALFKHQLG